MKRAISYEQIIQAKELYGQGKTTREIAKLYNCHPTVIQRWFKKLGIEVRDRSHSKIKYSIREDYFDNIDSEEKAYWLGYLYADGNVSKTKRVRLSLAEQDREVVEKFSYTIYGKDRVKKYIQPKGKLGQNLVYIDICNKHMALRLNELGCHPNKTFTLTFPEWLNKELYHHFVRGYFDGDGSIGIYKEKENYKGRAAFSILSTRELLLSLQLFFQAKDIHSVIYKIHKDKINNNYTLCISGNKQIQKVLDWIYTDATIFLQRKYDKYMELVKLNEAADIKDKSS